MVFSKKAIVFVLFCFLFSVRCAFKWQPNEIIFFDQFSRKRHLASHLLKQSNIGVSFLDTRVY